MNSTCRRPTEQEVLARHESLYRFLLKATQRDPNLRFQSADEMADQLAGVLREVVAGTAPAKPSESLHFQGDALAMHEEIDEPDSKLLPDLKVRADDPGAAYLLSIAGRRRLPAGREFWPRDAVLARFAGGATPPGANHDRTRLVRHGRGGGSIRAEKDDPFDWRVAWYRGHSLLA